MNLLDIARSAIPNPQPFAPGASPRRRPSVAEATELRELVARMRKARPEQWTGADETEAIEVGSQDIEAALVSFRLLAADAEEAAIWRPRG